MTGIESNCSMLDKPLFLTGFMGSGKSSIGVLLSKKLACPFIDLDNTIIETIGSSINNLFAVHGEAWFRTVETEQLHAVSPAVFAVVATGGGAVIAEKNRQFMHRYGIIINLRVTPEQVMERLKGSNDRPLLAGADAEIKAERLLKEREIYYADADIRIDTNGKTVEDVTAEIISYLKGCNT